MDTDLFGDDHAMEKILPGGRHSLQAHRQPICFILFEQIRERHSSLVKHIERYIL